MRNHMLPAGVLRSGDVLGDRYRLAQRVAIGGMGEVWQATDLVLARTVAVKVLLPALLEDPTFKTRFHVEARLLATVQHHGVVNVYDYGQSVVASGATVAFLVMAYVDGMPLSRWIAEAGRLSVAQTTSVVAQAADALHAAHVKGIVHSDVKPANLLVQRDGTVVLVDFGVARSTAVNAPGGNAMLATPLYMAPEQATRDPIGAATDIYALGAVMYHCLAGCPPFTGDDPLEIAAQHVRVQPRPLPADVPRPIQTLVLQALAKDPAARPPSGAAFAAAARAAATGPGILRPATAIAAGDPDATTVRVPVMPAGSGRRRRRAPAMAAGTALLIALAGGAAVTALRGQGGTPEPAAPVPAVSPTSPRSGATAPSSSSGAGQASQHQVVNLPFARRLNSPLPSPSTAGAPRPEPTASRPAPAIPTPPQKPAKPSPPGHATKSPGPKRTVPPGPPPVRPSASHPVRNVTDKSSPASTRHPEAETSASAIG
jgi:serine/threonine-protein kinase